MAYVPIRSLNFNGGTLADIQSVYTNLALIQGDPGFLHQTAAGQFGSRYGASVRVAVRDTSVAYPANQYVEGTIHTLGTGFPGNFVMAVLRASAGTGAAADYYSLEIDSSGGAATVMRVVKIVDGAAETLVNRTGDGWASGNTFRFRIVDGILKVYRNGAEIWSYDDTDDALTSGNPGMGALPQSGGFVGLLDDITFGEVTPDATAPTITSSSGGPANGPFTVSVAENSTAVAVTLTSDVALSSVVKAGTDGAAYSLAGSGLTRTLARNTGFNFEAWQAGGSVPEVVTLAFTDASANTRNVTINISPTNVAEPPNAPTIGVATAGDATVTVNGTPGAANGGPSITGYTATLSPGGLTKNGASLPITLTSADGVVNGTAYTATLTATNLEGTSPASAASNSVTPAAVTYTALTDIVAQAGIPIAEGTTVYWTWLQAGRPGAAAAVVHGSSLANAAGRVTVSHTVAGDGLVLLGLRPGPAISNDRVFAQFLTLA